MTRWSETDVRANVVLERGLRIPEVVRGGRTSPNEEDSPVLMRKTTRLFTAAPASRATPPRSPRAFHGPARRSRRRRSPRGRHPDPGNESRPARRLIFVLVVLALVLPFARPYARRDVPALRVAASVDDANSPHVLRRRRSNRLDRLRHYPRGPFDVALRASSTRGVRVLRLRDESTVG